MIGLRSVSVALAMLLLAAASLSCSVEAAGCAVCGRDECRNLSFTIHLTDGQTVETCCPRCALRYLETEKPDVARLEVKDFASARTLDARTAVYVEESDVHPCASGHDGPPKDERGCCMKQVYDRCLPSALAFADRGTAETFAREHGGFVTSFDRLETGVERAGS